MKDMTGSYAGGLYGLALLCLGAAIVCAFTLNIQDVTKRGDLVLDAFLGSGASLIAAERTGRRFRGLDIDPLYVDLAVERWRSLTGGKPELLRLAEAA